MGPRPLFGRVFLSFFNYVFYIFMCTLLASAQLRHVRCRGVGQVGGWGDVNVHVDVLTFHLLRYWSTLASAQLRSVCCQQFMWRKMLGPCKPGAFLAH